MNKNGEFSGRASASQSPCPGNKEQQQFGSSPRTVTIADGHSTATIEGKFQVGNCCEIFNIGPRHLPFSFDEYIRGDNLNLKSIKFNQNGHKLSNNFFGNNFMAKNDEKI